MQALQGRCTLYISAACLVALKALPICSTNITMFIFLSSFDRGALVFIWINVALLPVGVLLLPIFYFRQTRTSQWFNIYWQISFVVIPCRVLYTNFTWTNDNASKEWK